MLIPMLALPSQKGEEMEMSRRIKLWTEIPTTKIGTKLHKTIKYHDSMITPPPLYRLQQYIMDMFVSVTWIKKMIQILSYKTWIIGWLKFTELEFWFYENSNSNSNSNKERTHILIHYYFIYNSIQHKFKFFKTWILISNTFPNTNSNFIT